MTATGAARSKMPPHPNNFCSGRFADWLEVMLTPQCNGRCEWCVERGGFRPRQEASVGEIATAALGTGKGCIMLLGGEPTLYPALGELCALLDERHIYLTTNGSRLADKPILHILTSATGVNISLHHYNLAVNAQITGIGLQWDSLRHAIGCLVDRRVHVRLNCNIIRGAIDSEEGIIRYADFARRLGVGSLRFAELKHDNGFVSLREIMGDRFGLSEDPYRNGCTQDTTLGGCAVNFRQMCGLNTSYRPRPLEPKGNRQPVLYYDGKLYDGWQRERRYSDMDKKDIEELMQAVAEGKVNPSTAAQRILKDLAEADKIRRDLLSDKADSFCRY